MKWVRACLLFVLLLSGCYGQNGEIKPKVASHDTAVIADYESTVDQTTTKPIVLGFSQLGSESTWRQANTASIKEAAKEANITLLMTNAEQDQQKQFEAIRSFIRRDVDIIAIAPVVQTGWEPILKEAKQADIPVIIIDRSVNVQDSSLYVTFIGSNFYEEGVKASKYMIDRMRHHPGIIRIAELQGTVSSTPSINRGLGFRQMIATDKRFQITQSKPANFTQSGGYEVMREFLRQPRKNWPQVLFSHNDDMAIGAIKAIQEVGLQPGSDIIIISVDGTRRAFQQMAAGHINAVVECNPLLGPLVMQAAKEIMSGRTLPKRMITPEDIFTQELAAKEIEQRKY
ncbi:ABC transporter substrate-binding protein [Paenibacillus campi]|uniref:ABC transporter substrate-binding protein n=1 Tax=Paenibacillus campi TaxID=3106031 RepID=UPI002B002A2B|nr:ABC transporter substrate-binding protein [Paenibacillus sp. SGZ-1009]